MRALVGQLADRLRDVMRTYGWDPMARDAEFSSLAALETQDPKAAHERFAELRRALAIRHRADLLAALRAFPFVEDVPPEDARGMGLREVEKEARQAERAREHARAIAEALLAEADARASLTTRALAPAEPFPTSRWDALARLVEQAEARRRVAAREARVEARHTEAAKRASRLRVLAPPVPDVSRLPASEADEALEALEAALARAESLESLHASATRPLRDAAVAEWARESRRGLLRAADEALAARDEAALRGVEARASALRVEAAAKAEAATRARRKGTAPPERERRAGDAMDPYA